MTKTTNYTRVFVGDIARWPRERQLEKCREIEPDLQAVYEPTEFDLYLQNIRSDEVALMARLIALAERKPKKRPGVSFVIRLVPLLQKAAYIHDAHTGIKSTDGQPWLDLVESTYNTITRGRELPSEEAKRINKLSHEAREPGLVADWIDKKGTPEYMQAAQIWGNLGIRPAKYAISLFDDKELRTISPSTARLIFRSRRDCLAWLNEQT